MAEQRKTIWIPTTALSRRQLLVGGIAAALALAACGGDDDDAATRRHHAADGGGGTGGTTAGHDDRCHRQHRRHRSRGAHEGRHPARRHARWRQRPASTVSTSSARPTSPASATGWEPLLNFDPDYNIVNTDSIAEEVETKAADLYVVRLKEGVMFRDGKPVTADDVIYSFNRMLDPDSGGVRRLCPATDPRRVRAHQDRRSHGRDQAQAARRQLQRDAVRLHVARSCPTGTSASPAIRPTRSAPGRTSSRSSRSACSRSTSATRTTGTPASRTSTRCTSSTSPTATR